MSSLLILNETTVYIVFFKLEIFQGNYLIYHTLITSFHKRGAKLLFEFCLSSVLITKETIIFIFYFWLS